MQYERPACTSNYHVHAVVVTFHPEHEMFMQMIFRLAAQVSRLHVIDNTPGNSPVADWINHSGLKNIDLLALGKNVGIAAALNTGIHSAIEQGGTHILLSDQDSLPDENMVAGLTATWKTLAARDVNVGAVGPVFIERHTGIESSFQTAIPGKLFYGHTRADKENPIIEALILITSGTLISSKAFQEIGGMREDLFIDHVDSEWCLRARTHGFHIFGTSNARMFHHMGDHALRVWYFGWRQESAYSPLRVYYRVRNFIALCRLPTLRRGWKVRQGWYTLGVVYTQAFFGQQRLAALRMALLGLGDGLRKRMGQCQR